MKKIIIALWAAALAATSCTQTELVDNPQSTGYIEYEMYAKRPTRAAVISNTNFASFKVYAYQNINNVFSPYYEEMVSRVDATKPWGGEKPRKWPTGEEDFLNIYALSDPDNVTNYVPASGINTHPEFSYKVPTAENQKDLLASIICNVKNATFSGKLKLSFKHLLTQIAFKAKSSSAAYKMKVTKIEFKQIPSKGKFFFNDTNLESSYGYWQNQEEEPTDYTFTPNNAADDFAVSDAQQVLTSEHGNLMLLPSDNVSEKEMTVTYTVFKTDDPDDPGTTVEKTIKLGARENPEEILETWVMGTKHTYVLTLTGDNRAITFSATLDPWETEESSEEVDASDVFDVKVINDDGSGSAFNGNGPKAFSVTDNRLIPGAYSIVSNADWLTITDKADGSGAKQTVNYSADGAVTRAGGYEKTKTWYAVMAINGGYSERETTITVVRFGIANQSITVKQKNVVVWNPLEASSSLPSLAYAGSVQLLYVKKCSATTTLRFDPSGVNATANWDVYESGKGSSTLTIGGDNPAEGYRKLYLYIGPNPTEASREIKIVLDNPETFKGGFNAIQEGPDWTRIDRDGFNLKWTNGYLIRKAGSTTECVIGSRSDVGLYFVFGSLIGWGLESNPDGTGSTPWEGSYLPIVCSVRPASYTGSTTTYPGASFTVPEDGSTGTLSTSFDAATGIGDPCRHYLGSPWRLPTSAEMRAHLINGVADGSSYAEAGVSRDADVNYRADISLARSGFGHGSADGKIIEPYGSSNVWTSSYSAKEPIALRLGTDDKVSVNRMWGGLSIRCVSEE